MRTQVVLTVAVELPDEDVAEMRPRDVVAYLKGCHPGAADFIADHPDAEVTLMVSRNSRIEETTAWHA